MEETRIFLITYIAALAGFVAPGLVNISVGKICLVYGKKSGLYAALGASLAVMIQAVLAVLLARYIFDHPMVRNVLLRTGLVILVLLMIFFLVKALRGPHILPESEATSTKNSILKGMLVATLNIFPIPYFCAVAAAINVAGGASYNLLYIFMFCLAAAVGSFSVLYFYVVFFKRIENKMTSFTRYSNYFMALLMLILVVVTLVKIYYGD